jgi:hypothetical protein
MHSDLVYHWEKILQLYSEGVHRDTLIEAKEKYFKITGRINDDDSDFEPRMNSFNDWYIFQFVSDRGTTTVIKDYQAKNQLNEDLIKAFETIRHSLFHFVKRSFGKQIVLRDLLLGKKHLMDKEFENVGLLKDDLFTGRVITYQGREFLLPGICIVPIETKRQLAKQAKKVMKLEEAQKETEFLLQLEALKTKWRNYGHIASTKIFVFE